MAHQIHSDTEELQQILVDWNKTDAPLPQNRVLHQFFEQQALKTPNHIALINEKELLTYQELDEKANKLAHYLQNLGVKPNTFVAVCLNRSFDLIISILGILKAGGAYVPLDPSYPKSRLEYILKETQARVLITEPMTEGLPETEAHLICPKSEAGAIQNQPITSPRVLINSKNLAYIIYTSGSTGKPKGVMIEHQSVCNIIHSILDKFKFGEDNPRVLQFTSICFDVSVAEIWSTFARGATLCFASPNEKLVGETLSQAIQQYQITTLFIPPSVLATVEPDQVPSLKTVVVAGEAGSEILFKRWFSRVRLINAYGPTEATIYASFKIYDGSSSARNIGRPFNNYKVYILDEDQQPVVKGADGELYIGGMGVAQGYLNHPDLTQERFIINPFDTSDDQKLKLSRLYKTGDLVRYLTNGDIEFIDRIDYQIKIHGFRIELGEIENCLASHPLIKEAVVIAREHQIKEEKTSEKQIVAYYVLKNKGVINAPTHNELQQYLQNYLPDYMVPTFYVMLNEMPLNISGKIDRKGLPMPKLHSDEHYSAPRTELEDKLQHIWMEALSLKEISMEDNFFELGGHSLSAARIISKIKKLLNKEIKLNDLYHAPTISELATLISKIEDVNKESISIIENKLDVNSKLIPLNFMEVLVWFKEKFASKAKVFNTIDRVRVAGKLNRMAITSAFEKILKNHPILCYRISEFRPSLVEQEKITFQIIEKDLVKLTKEQQEAELNSSMDNLVTFRWKKGFPLITARLFYLENESSELQISVSHHIADEVSMQILFVELSTYYINFQSVDEHAIKFSLSPNYRSENLYRDYLFQRYNEARANFERDNVFWEDYLKDIASLSFPGERVGVRGSKQKTAPSYSSYFLIPEEDIQRFQTLCIKNHLSIADGLHAIVGLSLKDYISKSSNGNDNSSSIAINFVKSTRDNEIYDNAIGSFVKLDLIKMDLNSEPKLIELAKRIQQSVSDTKSHQNCPEGIKMAYLYKNRWKDKRIRNCLIKMLSYMYTKFYDKFKLPAALTFTQLIFLLEARKSFPVIVNISNNFSMNTAAKNLFGFQVQRTSDYKEQNIVLKSNNLHIRYIRDNQNNPSVIVSGNFDPDFRQRVGNLILGYLREAHSCSSERG